MSTDPFTEAARAEAERHTASWAEHANGTPDEQGAGDRSLYANAYVFGAEWARTHLAAQVPEVVIRHEEGRPATCEVRRGGVLIFSGRDHSADLRSTTQEPTDAEVLAALNADYALRFGPSNRPADRLEPYGDEHVQIMRAALTAARTARRDEEKR